MADISDVFLEEDSVKLVGTGESPVVNIEGENRWNLDDVDGDVRIGDDDHRLAISVSLGGAGRGTSRLRAKGGTEQLKLGAGSNDVVNIREDSVTINPGPGGWARLNLGREGRGNVDVYNAGDIDETGERPGITIEGGSAPDVERPMPPRILFRERRDGGQRQALEITPNRIDMARGIIRSAERVSASNVFGVDIQTSSSLQVGAAITGEGTTEYSPGTITVKSDEGEDDSADTAIEIQGTRSSIRFHPTSQPEAETDDEPETDVDVDIGDIGDIGANLPPRVASRYELAHAGVPENGPPQGLTLGPVSGNSGPRLRLMTFARAPGVESATEGTPGNPPQDEDGGGQAKGVFAIENEAGERVFEVNTATQSIKTAWEIERY